MKIVNVGVYFFSNLMKGLFPFLLLPILTNAMTVEEFGVIGIFQTFLVMLTPIIGLKGFGSASIRYYQVKEDLAAYNNTCIQILGIVVLSIVPIVYVFSGITRAFGISESLLILCVFCAAMKYMAEFRLNQWMIRENVKAYSKYQISESLAGFLLTIVLISVMEDKVDARVDAIFWSSLLFLAIALYSMRKDEVITFSVLYKFNYAYFKECLSYGVPLLPHALAGVAILSADRYVIGYYMGLEKVGLYMFAVTFSSIVTMFYNSINKVYSPWIYKNLSSVSESKIRSIKKYTAIFFAVNLPCYFVGINLLEFIVPIVANESYLPSIDALKIVLLGQVFSGFYLMVVNFVLYHRKTKTISSISIGCAVINVTMLFLLVPSFGIVGAAYSFLIANLLKFLLTALTANVVLGKSGAVPNSQQNK